MPTLRREQAQQMLDEARETIKKEYYDPTFHGVDIEDRFKQAQKRIRETNSLSESFGIIAWALESLNDSHTVFLPPPRPYDLENGWEVNFVGQDCYITAVQPGSDAASQGIAPGDKVLGIEGFRPTRENLHKLRYAFNTLAPRSAMHLVVAKPGSEPRQLLVRSSVVKLRQILTSANDMWDIIRRWENQEEEIKTEWYESGKVLVVKLHQFYGDEGKTDEIINRARQHEGLILDLRGNPGGNVEVLLRLVGGLFDHEIKVANRVGRKDQKERVAKSRGDHAFKGKLVVLVDSSSASAAEVLARVVQLEKRGLIVGDRSSGNVMEAKIFPHSGGVSAGFGYAFEVTVSNLVMADGKSLEHDGVTPDETVLPTAEDLAAARDPVLATAVKSLGGELTPEEAGKLFPIKWHKPVPF